LSSPRPISEVRRAALFNLIPSPKTLPSLLLRTVDLDPINRRAAFAHVLFEIPCSRLSQAQREEAIGRGLRDREEGVQKAAKKLVAKWTEEAGGVIQVSSSEVGKN
jgi:condensin complex subunit 3